MCPEVRRLRQQLHLLAKHSQAQIGLFAPATNKRAGLALDKARQAYVQLVAVCKRDGVSSGVADAVDFFSVATDELDDASVDGLTVADAEANFKSAAESATVAYLDVLSQLSK